ncbi:DUF3014 domain-containing protein [Thalassotalea aquiviva]|uniref:DUF3014 domain-containing protein n=1 Tax=Thalassotalea aquiviva TaxID=3242415 RepID=UPI00352BC86F
MSEQLSNNSIDDKEGRSSTVVFILIFCVVVATFVYLLIDEEQEQVGSPQTIIDESEVIITTEELEQPPELANPVAEPQNVETITEPDPIEPIKPKIALPKLEASDEFILAKISEISWRKELLDLIVTEDVIRRAVVFTDNFARGDLAYTHLPVKEPDGSFLTDTQGQDNEVFTISDVNQQRYLPYIDLLNSFEPETLVAQFIQTKPLFEKAFNELGYPNLTFDDVLQQAIDRVLDMRVINEDVELVRPNVIYQYKDSDLEAMSPADKFLLRIGKENLLQLKAVALELNNQLNLQKN